MIKVIPQTGGWAGIGKATGQGFSSGLEMLFKNKINQIKKQDQEKAALKQISPFDISGLMRKVGFEDDVLAQLSLDDYKKISDRANESQPTLGSNEATFSAINEFAKGPSQEELERDEMAQRITSIGKNETILGAAKKGVQSSIASRALSTFKGESFDSFEERTNLKDPTWVKGIMYGMSKFVWDSPLHAVGGTIGAAKGARFGPIGSLVGGGSGFMALPASVESSLKEYQKYANSGKKGSFKDFLEASDRVAGETITAGTEGALLGSLSKIPGIKGLLKIRGGKAAEKAINTGVKAGIFTTSKGISRLEVPTKEEYANDLGMFLGFDLIAATGRHAPKAYDILKKAKIPPKEAAAKLRDVIIEKDYDTNKPIDMVRAIRDVTKESSGIPFAKEKMAFETEAKPIVARKLETDIDDVKKIDTKAEILESENINLAAKESQISDLENRIQKRINDVKVPSLGMQMELRSLKKEEAVLRKSVEDLGGIAFIEEPLTIPETLKRDVAAEQVEKPPIIEKEISKEPKPQASPVKTKPISEMIVKKESGTQLPVARERIGFEKTEPPKERAKRLAEHELEKYIKQDEERLRQKLKPLTVREVAKRELAAKNAKEKNIELQLANIDLESFKYKILKKEGRQKELAEEAFESKKLEIAELKEEIEDLEGIAKKGKIPHRDSRSDRTIQKHMRELREISEDTTTKLADYYREAFQEDKKFLNKIRSVKDKVPFYEPDYFWNNTRILNLYNKAYSEALERSKQNFKKVDPNSREGKVLKRHIDFLEENTVINRSKVRLQKDKIASLDAMKNPGAAFLKQHLKQFRKDIQSLQKDWIKQKRISDMIEKKTDQIYKKSVLGESASKEYAFEKSTFKSSEGDTKSLEKMSKKTEKILEKSVPGESASKEYAFEKSTFKFSDSDTKSLEKMSKKTEKILEKSGRSADEVSDVDAKILKQMSEKTERIFKKTSEGRLFLSAAEGDGKALKQLAEKDGISATEASSIQNKIKNVLKGWDGSSTKDKIKNYIPKKISKILKNPKRALTSAGMAALIWPLREWLKKEHDIKIPALLLLTLMPMKGIFRIVSAVAGLGQLAWNKNRDLKYASDIKKSQTLLQKQQIFRNLKEKDFSAKRIKNIRKMSLV